MALGLSTLFSKSAWRSPCGSPSCWACFCTTLLGVCLDRVWFRPLRQRQARAAMMAISSAWPSFCKNLIRMLWGPQVHYYSREIHLPFTVPVLQVRLNTP